MASIDPVDRRQSPGCSTAKSVLARYEAEIACYAAHLTCDRAQADTLYQESMLQARNGFDCLEGAANYRLWLYTIATGAFLSDRGRSGPNGSGDQWQAAEARDTIPNHINPRGVPDLLPKMEEFAASLPRRQWEALVQRMYHNQSYAVSPPPWHLPATGFVAQWGAVLLAVVRTAVQCGQSGGHPRRIWRMTRRTLA